MRISRATPEQFGAVLELVDPLREELSGSTPTEALDRSAIEPQLLAASAGFAAFLAFADNEAPIGVATLTEAVAAYAGGRYGILSELYVDPRYRDSGVGRQLLDAVRAEGRMRGWRRIDVSAPSGAEWDQTFRFYEKNGFVFTGRKLKYVLDE